MPHSLLFSLACGSKGESHRILVDTRRVILKRHWCLSTDSLRPAPWPTAGLWFPIHDLFLLRCPTPRFRETYSITETYIPWLPGSIGPGNRLLMNSLGDVSDLVFLWSSLTKWAPWSNRFVFDSERDAECPFLNFILRSSCGVVNKHLGGWDMRTTASWNSAWDA